ncbi:O-antigen ligase family protein [Limosilactobacillus albertensis]|uniref:O-antigen ligase family protein n=1 Tax=Limosilactobacillus albertensis TaxID=2759752 RepID=A0A839HB55_9LACO|nr:O-antigen ligase family protein [Limosilactobacillus albertensis]MBB1124548.1 O-antigen ligase family protein [Limosilactobacillus albertensis]MCD7123082.1 O-antigen ligase family protein [Limosilactobacillus albertensis]
MLSSKGKVAATYIFLLVILPIMDSLNGLLNGGGNENGLSLGIVYRLIIVVVSVMYWCFYGLNKRALIYLLLIFVYLLLSVIGSTDYGTTYIILLFKLMLPIIIIETIRSLYNNNKLNSRNINFIMNSWLLLFPLTMIIPYFLGIGFSTYGDSTSISQQAQAGFKGLYYAQNDISYVIDILYLYVINKVSMNTKILYIAEYIMVLIVSLIMGLKGNYLIIAVVTVYYVFKGSKDSKSRLQKFILLIMVIIGIAAIFTFFMNDLNTIIQRWQYFYNKNGFLSFFTSTRSDRIAPTYNWISEIAGIKGFLFGTGYNYTIMIPIFKFVEMDIFDILFQLGIVGAVLIYGYYFSIYLKNKHIKFYSGAFLLTILISTLSGHVFETALSGVFFAVICSGLIVNSNSDFKGESLSEG